MWNLFSTSSDKAGYRLEYMELYNWGGFHNHVFSINPQGSNSLLTGANASGKSTFIDALLTLIVPAKKDRFYNQSSGVEKKGDRSEVTYTLGHYGNIQEEGKTTASTQKLRGTSTYSVMLASFSNANQKQITLFQVRWFSNNELKRQFGIAHVPLHIDSDFGTFDAKGLWKRRLDKTYNAHSSKKKIEFLDGPTAYAERMTHLFGMRSVKALTLFNQVVGVKVLEDLDKFIRENMLEERDAEAEFIQLKESFNELMDAKTNIEKVIEQIAQLRPIDEIAIALEKIQNEITQLGDSKEMAAYWFAQKAVVLGEAEQHKCQEYLARLDEELSILKNKENDLREEERTIANAIEKDEVGNQIKVLTSEIKKLEEKRIRRRSKLDKYNQVADNIRLSTDPSEESFWENREQAQALKESTQKQIEEENEQLRHLKNKEDAHQHSIEELVSTVQTLQKNKNNIAGMEARIREELLAYVGASKEEIPFVGELIKVREDAQAWEVSIEKALHDFALHLIVPPNYYAQVNEYVHTHELQGHIRYHKYEKQEYLTNMRQNELTENAFVNKIQVKTRNQYRDWLEHELLKEFNFTCVEDLTAFDRFSEMAITQNGLIKHRGGRHEKDDRLESRKKENFVLGWDNKEKIAALKQELKNLQLDQKTNLEAIKSSKAQLKSLGFFKDDCQYLFSQYTQYDDINWQSYANNIQEKSEQKEALEKTNDRVKKLQEQLETVQKELQELSDVTISNKNENIFRKRQENEQIANFVKQNQELLSSVVKQDSSAFEQQNKDLLHISYQNFRTLQDHFWTQNRENINKLNSLKQKKEREISMKITAFKQPDESITMKFRDWRSDVHKLPDATHLEFISEYQKFLKALEKDNLPKYEKKFNDYLRETITNKVGDFRMFFQNWSESIRDNIKHLNDSLRAIDFKNNPKTYIQLVSPNKFNDEVKEFRSLLDKAVPNVRELDAVIDGRKNHFNHHIAPFISKLEKEDWRKKVMDVRSWFSYKAEEFYKENNQKFKTYENMGQLSGGEKAQLTYTILGSAIAYQFGLTKEGLQSNSFRFIAIDEAFKAQDEDKARYLINLCKQLHLQLLVVTPSDNIHIVEKDISFVHFTERKEEKYSWLYDMTIEQFQKEKDTFLTSAS